MNTFRGKPFPGCRYHERSLMRCAVAFRIIHGPDEAAAFVLSCPDCDREYRQGITPTMRTPQIAITRAEFDACPANPAPFMIDSDGRVFGGRNRRKSDDLV